MAIDVTCPECGEPMRFSDRVGGKKVRCANCEAEIVLPAAADNPEDPPARPPVVAESRKPPRRAPQPPAPPPPPPEELVPAIRVTAGAAPRHVPSASSRSHAAAPRRGTPVPVVLISIGAAGLLGLVILVALYLGQGERQAPPTEIAAKSPAASAEASARDPAAPVETEAEAAPAPLTSAAKTRPAPADQPRIEPEPLPVVPFARTPGPDSSSALPNAGDEPTLPAPAPWTPQTPGPKSSVPGGLLPGELALLPKTGNFSPFSPPDMAEEPEPPDATETPAPPDATPDHSPPDAAENPPPAEANPPATSPDAAETPSPPNAQERPAPPAAQERPASPKSKSPRKRPGADPPEPEAMTGPPDAGCPTCRGSGKVPFAPFRPYVAVEGSPAPKAEWTLPGRYCPTCQRGRKEGEAEIEQEVARFKAGAQRHEPWEKKTEWSLVLVQTHLATVHAQLPPAEALRVGMALEGLAQHLQELTGSLELTLTRPDSFDMIIVWEQANYQQLLTLMEPQWRPLNPNNWELLPQVAGGICSETAFFRQLEQAPPPAHLAVSLTASQQIALATGHRAPAWLQQGFCSYCEYAVLRKNLVHAIDYLIPEVQLNPDWWVAMQQLAAVNRLRPWDNLFGRELRDYTTPDYVTTFSTVAFLLRSQPQKFLDFARALSGGQEAPAALAASYGKPAEQLQAAWLQWLAAPR